MGWGRTLLLGDIGNRLDIGDVESDLAFLKQRLRENVLEDQDQGGEIRRLQTELEEMKLVVTTLVRLLAKKGIIEDGEIRAVAKGIELSPGHNLTSVSSWRGVDFGRKKRLLWPRS